MFSRDRALKKLAFSIFAKRFVAGDCIEDAICCAKGLKGKRVRAVINFLGEHATTSEEIAASAEQYIALIGAIRNAGLDSHIAVKLSQLGLTPWNMSDGSYGCYAEERCADYLRGIVSFARQFGIMVEIDREGPELCDSVRRVFLGVRHDWPFSVRLATQVNMRQTEKELKEDIERGISVRLCKGAYQGDVPGTDSLRNRFIAYIRPLLEKGYRPAFATHDLEILGAITREVSKRGGAELQMLYGIENGYAAYLAASGFLVRLYIPYGPNWFAYGKRRAREVGRILLRNSLYRIQH